jgi:hypothetical protein
MPIYHPLSIRLLLLGLVFISGLAGVTAVEQHDHGAVSFARRITFELTFANRDLIWFGDPASPTTSVYLKPGAHPMATDLCVSTLVENNESPSRHYFREARITKDNGNHNVYAFTSQCEKVIGTIDQQGRFLPNEFYRNNRKLLPSWPADASVLAYDPKENALSIDVEIPGPLVSESLDFLPLEIFDDDHNSLAGRFSIDYSPSDDSSDVVKSAVVSLTLQNQDKSITLAEATLPSVFRGADVQMGSFDNQAGTYLPESVYRAGTTYNQETIPSVTVTVAGEFTSSVQGDVESLVVVDTPAPTFQSKDSPAKITIDGNFDDWRNVAGIDDPRGDLAPYLEYVSDVDLLEFKVSHDDKHIYLYARVAGQVGRSHPLGGRSYFYAYMDVDRNPDTGFLPTRDDDCYYGVDIGDDCEVQFEFVNNAFRKTFYGFCGIGGNDNVLKQEVTLGKSQYGRFDKAGFERSNYKSEYIFRNGTTQITEDLKLGTSDTIHLAVSPDGSEVEVVSTFTGFLKNPNGQPTVRLGQTIDLAVGMECDSKIYPGKTRWAADSTAAIHGYQLNHTDSRTTSKQPISIILTPAVPSVAFR